MKNNLLILLLVILVVACSKEKMRFHGSIKAGVKEGLGIKYVDVIPDDTVSGYLTFEEMMLDMDGDGNGDFLLSSRHSDAVGIGDGGSWITSQADNKVAVVSDAIVDTIANGEVIDAGLNWGSGLGILYYYYYSFGKGGATTGLWGEAQDKYIGVMIQKGSDKLYGWIQIEITVCGSQKLMAYAITESY